MAFRRSVPQAELAAKLTSEEQAKHATTFQGNRGGHFPLTQAQRMNEQTEITVERADKPKKKRRS
jgi:hypothetical protein